MLSAVLIACLSISPSIHAHLELVNEHGNRVKLVALVLVLHIHDLSFGRSVKERMAVVQDSIYASCSQPEYGGEVRSAGRTARWWRG